MNNIRIIELTNFNISYHAGNSQEILYRCTLLAPFVTDALKEFPEYNKEQVLNSMSKWFDMCEDNNIEIVESLIELYNFNTVNNQPVEMYESYPELFERMVDFLLGKITWQPNAHDKTVAVDCSNNLTAQLLNHIYLNK
jgi:hypothetical protein